MYLCYFAVSEFDKYKVSKNLDFTILVKKN